jgi:hypothetical protein
MQGQFFGSSGAHNNKRKRKGKERIGKEREKKEKGIGKRKGKKEGRRTDFQNVARIYVNRLSHAMLATPSRL